MPKKRTFFPHLHIHDEHSIKDGCSTVETYADIVQSLGGDSLAITNHGQASGYARQFFACRDRKIKPIYGMEIYINEHRTKPVKRLIEKLKEKADKKVPGAKERLARAKRFRDNKFRKSAHSIILAKNEEGYRNLVKLSTDSWVNGLYYNPRTDTKFLEENQGGLIFSTACIGGHIPRLARNNFDEGVAEARRIKGIFGDDFYVEIMMTEYEAQRETNEVMLRLAGEIKAPVIVTCDVHYAKPEDGLAQDVLLLMRDKKTIKDKEAGEGGWQFDAKDLYWRTLEDVTSCWKTHHSDYIDSETIRQAIKNTYRVAEEIEQVDFDTSLKLPGVFEEAENTLKEMCLRGLRERMDHPGCPAPGRTKRDYASRLVRELKVVNGKGFAEYFLILEDLCEHARSIGSRMGPGRGSAGGSLIAFILKITQIDPLRFDLLFERFLDASRPDLPDIDLDFSPEHRDPVKAYVEKKYPATATVGTFAKFKPRAILGAVGRVFNIDYRELLKVTKSLGDRGDDKTWEEIFDLCPAVEKFANDYPEAFDVVKTLKGLISHRGKHASAMLVGPASALDVLPMIVESTGQVVTAFADTQGDGIKYDGRELSRLGCVKLDILGVANLNVSPGAVEILQREEGIVVDLEADLEMDDPLTLEIASQGDVPGVFQLDSDTTRPILRHVGVDCFADLVMVTALCRPGPLNNNVHYEFAKLKRGGESWRRTVPEELEDLLQDSRGLMILQEDVMHVVKVIGGFSGIESNRIRKDISKKLTPKLESWKGQFVKGGLANGYEEAELEEVWSKIVTFGDYGFCKAHAVAYMITAYRQCYMLAHYPLYYFASLLATTPRDKKTSKGVLKMTAFVRAAMSHNAPVLGPCVVRSGVEFDVAHGSIRFGLGKIKDVKGAAPSIVAARPFLTFEEFFNKVTKRRVNLRVVKALIYSGAMDELPFETGCVFCEEQAVPGTLLCEGHEDEEENLRIVERRNALRACYHRLRKDPGEPETFTLSVMQNMEREYLGLAFSWWSSDDKDELREQENLMTVAQALESDRNKLALLVEVAHVRTHKTAKGNMAFCKVADETGTLENITIWASQWDKVRTEFRLGRIIILRLDRQESRNRSYGRWTYFLDNRKKRRPSIESAQRLLRQGR